MNINRHNYEEYFILYLDNELSSDDRRMVEAFVLQHPDLKEELDILLQYKLVPDTNITFTGKEELMKVNGDTPITLTNYDEWLVLYMDNELTAGQRVAVEQFITDNPSAKEELALLQRTQLQPETIFFADKASLYRTEEEVRPTPVRWWRLAAAAVLLLGVGITTAVLVNKKSSGTGEIVKGTTPEKKTIIETPLVTPKVSDNPVNSELTADNNQKVPAPAIKQAVNNNSVAVKENNNAVKQVPVIITPQAVKEEQVVANNDKPTNNLPQPLNNPNINRNDASNNAIASNNPPKEIIKQQDALTNPVVTTQNPSSSDIVYASNNNTDAASFDESDGKKNKNRGFFRKVARTFEKRTNIDPTDDNRLLVAGLSIKLK
jgi:anti-sigma factor RsiW